MCDNHKIPGCSFLFSSLYCALSCSPQLTCLFPSPLLPCLLSLSFHSTLSSLFLHALLWGRRSRAWVLPLLQEPSELFCMFPLKVFSWAAICLFVCFWHNSIPTTTIEVRQATAFLKTSLDFLMSLPHHITFPLLQKSKMGNFNSIVYWRNFCFLTYISGFYYFIVKC